MRSFFLISGYRIGSNLTSRVSREIIKRKNFFVFYVKIYCGLFKGFWRSKFTIWIWATNKWYFKQICISFDKITSIIFTIKYSYSDIRIILLVIGNCQQSCPFIKCQILCVISSHKIIRHSTRINWMIEHFNVGIDHYHWLIAWLNKKYFV